MSMVETGAMSMLTGRNGLGKPWDVSCIFLHQKLQMCDGNVWKILYTSKYDGVELERVDQSETGRRSPLRSRGFNSFTMPKCSARSTLSIVYLRHTQYIYQPSSSFVMRYTRPLRIPTPSEFRGPACTARVCSTLDASPSKSLLYADDSLPSPLAYSVPSRLDYAYTALEKTCSLG